MLKIRGGPPSGAHRSNTSIFWFIFLICDTVGQLIFGEFLGITAKSVKSYLPVWGAAEKVCQPLH